MSLLQSNNGDLEIVGNKTPKMIVNEACAKRKVVPDWKSREILSTTPPTFKCVCTIPNPLNLGEELSTEAVGRTKKGAEHEAALLMIPQLLSHEEIVKLTGGGVKRDPQQPQHQPITKNAETVDNDPVSETDEDVITGEPIGDLNTVCLRYQLGLPQFTDEVRKGRGNTNIFTVKCSLSSRNLTKVGRRLRKQDGKRVAAFRVLRELRIQGYTTETSKGSNAYTPRPVNVVVAPAQQTLCAEVSSSVGGPGFSDENGNVSTFDDNIVKQSMAVIMEKLRNTVKKGNLANNGTTVVGGVAGSGSVASSTEQDNGIMEIDPAIIDKIKRKLGERHDALSPAKMSKYGPFATVKCDKPTEQCLKFVKDYAHAFQHLPSTDSLEKSLISNQFQQILSTYGGPLNLLKKSAADAGIKYRFGPSVKLTDGSTCIFLMMNFPLDLKLKVENTHAVNGVGDNKEMAKQKAALEALKFLKLMMFDSRPFA